MTHLPADDVEWPTCLFVGIFEGVSGPEFLILFAVGVIVLRLLVAVLRRFGVLFWPSAFLGTGLVLAVAGVRYVEGSSRGMHHWAGLVKIGRAHV